MFVNILERNILITNLYIIGDVITFVYFNNQLFVNNFALTLLENDIFLFTQYCVNETTMIIKTEQIIVLYLCEIDIDTLKKTQKLILYVIVQAGYKRLQAKNGALLFQFIFNGMMEISKVLKFLTVAQVRN